MSENTEKKSTDFASFMEGKGGKYAIYAAATFAVACIAFAGFRSYRIVSEEGAKTAIALDENQDYRTRDEVAGYIYKFGHLPDNYITKTEAHDAGWIYGNVSDVVPGKDIGGDRFYISYYKGDDVAKAEGRYFIECDVNTEKWGDRGRERIIYSNDGLVYYTSDHYQSFMLLYGQEVLDEFY